MPVTTQQPRRLARRQQAALRVCAAAGPSTSSFSSSFEKKSDSVPGSTAVAEAVDAGPVAEVALESDVRALSS